MYARPHTHTSPLFWPMRPGRVPVPSCLRGCGRRASVLSMSNVCSFCQVKEASSAGKWLVCGDCKGRRDPPSSQRDTCADNGFATSVGPWSPDAPAPFRCNICRAMDAAKHRDSVVGENKSRCDPTSVCRDNFTVCPWMVGLRRASPSDLRAAMVRATKSQSRPVSRACSGVEVRCRRTARRCSS